MRNGGSCIFIKNETIESLTRCSRFEQLAAEKYFELSATEVKLRNIKQKIIVFCIYRSPNSNFNNFIDDLNALLSMVINERKIIVLCGDFNVDRLKESREKRILETLFATMNFNIAHHGPTRITNMSVSSIDYIVTNFPLSRYKSSVVCVPFSDHEAVQITIGGLKSSTQVRQKETKPTANLRKNRKIKEIHYQMLNSILSSETWYDVLEKYNVDHMFDVFLNKFLAHLNDVVPETKIKNNVNYKTPWLTKGIKISSQKLKAIHQIMKFGLYRNNNNLIYINTSNGLIFITIERYYKLYKNIYQKILKLAKRKYINKYIVKSTNKTKAVWEIVKQETKQSGSKLLKFNIKNEAGELVDGEKAANLINDYLINIPADMMKRNIKYNCHSKNSIRVRHLSDNMNKNNIDNNDEHNYNLNKCNNLILSPTNEIELEKIIKNLNNKTSTDIYGISNILIKRTCKGILKPLCVIINLSLKTGIVPNRMKLSKITPVYKSGKKTDPESYRPISGIPIFGKILENVVLNKLMIFIENGNIISKNQFGFRKKMSTTKAIFNFLDDIYRSIDEKANTLGLFADLSKAFDTVCHNVLLLKLSNAGINGIALSWFASYLSNRFYRVEIHEANKTYKSKWQLSRFGVPQGSLLGPVLFLVYIDDLPKVLSPGQTTLYADDATVLVSNNNLKELENCCCTILSDLNEWLLKNFLNLNLGKTNYLLFRKQSCGTQINYRGKTINRATSSKMLGLILDDQLTWEPHIEHLKNKLCSAVYAIRKLIDYLDLKSLKSVYYGYVHSMLSYGIVFWGGATRFGELFKIQKWVVRLMKRANRRTSCRPLFKELDILPLPCLYLYELLTFIKRNCCLFKKNSDIHDYATRQRNDFCIEQHRTSLYERGPRGAGIALYNRLPRGVSDLEEKQFCVMLRKILIENVFYSTGEFVDYFNVLN
jgi:hypothetical protein